MRSFLLAIACAATFGATTAAEERASLAAFPGVADVVVTSAHPDLSEDQLRRLVEARLRKVRLLADPSALAGRLSLRVSGDHNTSMSGTSFTSYDVALTVTEPASLERDVSIRVSAVVWQATKRLSVFSKDVPSAAVVDKVQDLLSALAADVEAARQGK